MTFSAEDISRCRAIAHRPRVKKADYGDEVWGAPPPTIRQWGMPRYQRQSDASSAPGWLWQNYLGQNGLFGQAKTFLAGDEDTNTPGFISRTGHQVMQGNSFNPLTLAHNLFNPATARAAWEDTRNLTNQGASNNPYIERMAGGMARAMDPNDGGGFWGNVGNYLGGKALDLPFVGSPGHNNPSYSQKDPLPDEQAKLF